MRDTNYNLGKCQKIAGEKLTTQELILSYRMHQDSLFNWTIQMLKLQLTVVKHASYIEINTDIEQKQEASTCW